MTPEQRAASLAVWRTVFLHPCLQGRVCEWSRDYYAIGAFTRIEPYGVDLKLSPVLLEKLDVFPIATGLQVEFHATQRGLYFRCDLKHAEPETRDILLVDVNAMSRCRVVPEFLITSDRLTTLHDMPCRVVERAWLNQISICEKPTLPGSYCTIVDRRWATLADDAKSGRIDEQMRQLEAILNPSGSPRRVH